MERRAFWVLDFQMIFILVISETKASPTRVYYVEWCILIPIKNNSKFSEYILCIVCGGEVRNGVIAFEVFTSNLGQCTGWGGAPSLGWGTEGFSEPLTHAKSWMIPVAKIKMSRRLFSKRNMMYKDRYEQVKNSWGILNNWV